MFWVGLFVGIVVWQIVALAICFIWRDEENKAIVAITGIPYLVCLGLMKAYELFRKQYLRAKLKAAMLDFDGKLCYCESSEAIYYKRRGYAWAEFIGKKYPIDGGFGWNKKDCIFGGANVRRTPIKLLKMEKAYRLPHVSKKILKEL